MYNELIEYFNNYGKMILTYNSPVLSVCDTINLGEPGSILSDVKDGYIEVSVGEVNITINMDKFQYDEVDEIYSWKDGDTDVSISFI